MEALNIEADKFCDYLEDQKEEILKALLEIKPRNKSEATTLNRAYTYIKYFSK